MKPLHSLLLPVARPSFSRLLRRFAGLLIFTLTFTFPFALTLSAASSDPVGVLRLKLRGNSDTVVSLPLHRPALVEAQLTDRAGNTLTLDSTIPPLPAGGAYALVMTGSLEGAVLPIASAHHTNITLDPAADDLTALTFNDTLAIIPYWTLDTVFPAGAGAHPSASPTNLSTEIHLFDGQDSGIQLAATGRYFYFAGNASKAAGWYKVGATASPCGSTRLAPGQHFLVRHNIATDSELMVAGAVQMAKFRIPLHLRSANTDQDNLVALPVPTPISLGDSQLVSSGAFVASPSPTNTRDILMVFDNATVARQKVASARYFYFSGNASKPAGWYKIGSTTTTSDDVLLSPGEGFIIRKYRAASPRTDVWHGLPPFLQ
jgi:Verrucomicrobium spinosum paralogous family TIGR02597